MVKEEVSPHIKDHNGTKICFADTLTQASNALKRQQLPEGAEPGDLNEAHLMLFGVEDWNKSKVTGLNKALGDGLNTFKRLEIFGCEIDEALQKELANGLTGGNLEHVTQLDLDNTSLSVAGAKAIFDNVTEAQAIEILNLQGSVKDADVLKAIETSLVPNSNIFRHLRKVDLKINDLKQAAGEPLKNLIGKFLSHDEVELDLFYNDLQAQGAREVATGLQLAHCYLTHLDMCCNNIGDAGAGFLASALRTNTSLQVLKLALNNIGNDGGIALFSTLVPSEDVNLRTNETLKVLDLSANVMKGEVKKGELNDAEAQRLAELMDETKYPKGERDEEWFVERSKLQQKKQDKQDLAEILCRVLLQAHYLNEIDFTGIEFDDAGWDFLGQQLAQTHDIPERVQIDEAEDKMIIKFSIVDLMSTDRLTRMEEQIWNETKKDTYSHIDWRRRDTGEKKEEEKTN